LILAEQHGDIQHGHPIEVLRTMSIGHGGVDRSLQELNSRNWVMQLPSGNWILTEKGFSEAKKLSDDGEKLDV
jgi:hypothetical protein